MEEKSLVIHEKLARERMDKIYQEANILKNESKKMHFKILQLQILDKQKKTLNSKINGVVS